MCRFLIKTAMTIILGVSMLGCAARGPVKPLPDFAPSMLNASDYTARVDNFLIIFDASSSMEEWRMGQKKFTMAREVVSRMNQTLPELGQTAGLRSFGHHKSISLKSTRLFYGMEPYSTKGLEKGLASIKVPGGISPLSKALDAARTDLGDISGKTALIIISDGKNMTTNVKASVQALKDVHGPSLCIYPILVGDDANGRALLESLAEIGGCGFISQAQSLLSTAGMTQFVENVFLSKRVKTVAAPPKVAAADSDNDGIIDSLDQCPGTPPNVPVDRNGCPFDSDHDGVYDYMDDCPGTPLGAMVNDRGCWIIGGVLFDFDKAVIKPQGKPTLDKVVDILKKNPDLRISLEGHTCNIGTAKYNQGLSMRRAKAVKAYLVDRGIDASRLSCRGFGFSRPAASNATKEGRIKNRRTELKPIR